jgi:hypothetical protein
LANDKALSGLHGGETGLGLDDQAFEIRFNQFLSLDPYARFRQSGWCIL